jgi:hypothetical protein
MAENGERDRPQTVEEREQRREELRQERWEQQQEQLRKDVDEHELTQARRQMDEENQKLAERLFKAREEHAREEQQRREEEERELGPDPAFHPQPEVAYSEQTWGAEQSSVETTQNVGGGEPRTSRPRNTRAATQRKPEDAAQVNPQQ